jgi:hypothetical protein
LLHDHPAEGFEIASREGNPRRDREREATCKFRAQELRLRYAEEAPSELLFMARAEPRV